MGFPAGACPTREQLVECALGKLDAAASETIGAHLTTCNDCRSVVASLSRAGSAQSIAPDQSSASPGSDGAHPNLRAIPAELADHPDYEIVRELGQGGMGIVYLARNRMMDRLEVLKVVSRSLLDRPGAMERFQQEIRSAARLGHPNIVAAYSVIRAGNLLVLCMEYVDGQDLGETVKQRGPLPVVNAAFYIHQVALGLQHAHEKEMVHRDIKPGNLMLAVVNKKHVVKILDFGLAKATSEKLADGGLTKSGQMLGTPDYIAPEQTLDAQKADIRADIYSLGCTLYYVLSGRPPFDGASLYEILHAHHSVDAQPLNLVRPEVPVELAAVVAKMMAKDPANRYHTPIEVVQALKPFFQAGGHATKTDHSLPPQAAPPIPPQPQMPLPGQGGPIPVPLARAVALAAPQHQPVAAAAPGLADLETMTSAGRSKPAVKPKARGDSGRWKTPVILVAAGLAGLLLLAAVMFKVRTRDGILGITVSEPSPEVTIDGEQVKVSWADGGKQAEIRVVAGSHKIELKKDGYKIIGERVEIERAGRLFLSAKLEPLPKPEQATIAATANEPASSAAISNRELAGHSVPPSDQPAASGQQTAGLAPAARQPTVYQWSPGTPPPALAPFNARQARAHQEAWAKHLGVPVEQTNSIGMKLVLIPPGEFAMGSTEEQIAASEDTLSRENGKEFVRQRFKCEIPQHRVAISRAFLMGANEVTIGDYKQFVEETKYVTEAERFGFGGSSSTTLNDKITPQQRQEFWKTTHGSDDFPVGLVTWNDAIAYCNWLSDREKLSRCYDNSASGDYEYRAIGTGYRLPTEAEWEYACRAGTTTKFSFGDDVNQLNYDAKVANDLQPVRSKKANSFGLYDMHGNVQEWCNDWFLADYYLFCPNIDPQGPQSGESRVVRGGSIGVSFANSRSAYRNANALHTRWLDMGFRAVVSAGPATKRLPAESAAASGKRELASDSMAAGSTPRVSAGVDRAADFIERLDKNGDGKLNKDEAPKRIRENFDKFDANRDGHLEPEELAKVFREPSTGEAKPVAPTADADREAVKFVLATGGEAVLIDPGSYRSSTLKPGADLPDGPFYLGRANFARQEIGDDTLLPLGALTRLLRVHFTACRISDGAFSPLTASRSVTAVGLLACKVSDECLQWVERMPSLTELAVVSSTGFTDRGLSYFSRCARLRIVKIGSTRITDAGVKNLVGLPLAELYISDNRIGDDAMAAIGELRDLKMLYIGNTGITDRGVPHLKKLVKLETLHVELTELTVAGLTQLRSLPRLGSLLLGQCTERQLRQLRQALPRCNISVANPSMHSKPLNIVRD